MRGGRGEQEVSPEEDRREGEESRIEKSVW